MTLAEFVLARRAEDEQWARESSRCHYLPPGVEGVGRPEDYAIQPGGVHWQWVCGRNDEVLTVDPMLGEFLECSDGCVSAELRSVERWSTGYGDGLPQMPLPGSEEVVPPVAGHIARHDPARVLRRVDADRRIVALHHPLEYRGPGDPPGCAVCSWRDDQDQLHGDWPCPTLRLLGAVDDDHPDYQPEWRP
jgi:hypothetical protein